MKTAIILVSEAGYATAEHIRKEFDFPIFSLHEEEGTSRIRTIDEFLQKDFHTFDAFIFVGALGICVPASLLTSKTSISILLSFAPIARGKWSFPFCPAIWAGPTS